MKYVFKFKFTEDLCFLKLKESCWG